MKLTSKSKQLITKLVLEWVSDFNWMVADKHGIYTVKEFVKRIESCVETKAPTKQGKKVKEIEKLEEAFHDRDGVGYFGRDGIALKDKLNELIESHNRLLKNK